MHIVRHPRRQRIQRRMYLPSERQVVNGVGLGSGTRYTAGLGEVDGLFNIGKMFTRMFTIRPKSFTFKNIMGAVGSVTTFTATGGLSSFLPKVTGAHSALMRDVGMGVTAAAGLVAGGLAVGAMLPAAGAGAATIGTAAAGSTEIAAATGAVATGGGGILSAVGSGISAVGSGLMNVVKALPLVGQLFGGGGGQQVVQEGQYPPGYAPMTQAQYDAQVRAQQAYEAQVAAQQAALYTPGGYVPSIPGLPGQYTGPVAPSMDTSYGDLRSPYTAVTEDGQQVQVDPATGQVIQPGMSTEMMISIAAMVLVGGVYFMSGNEKK